MSENKNIEVVEGESESRVLITWFPHDNGIVVHENPNRLQSFFIGLTWFPINSPIIFWKTILRPLSMAVFRFLILWPVSFWRGASGNLIGLKLPPGVIAIKATKKPD